MLRCFPMRYTRNRIIFCLAGFLILVLILILKSFNSNSSSHESQTLWYVNNDQYRFSTIQNAGDVEFQKDIARLLVVAKKIARRKKFLFVSFINNAFLPFAYSWLCNTQHMGVHDQLVIIAADRETEEKFRRVRPDIEVVSLSGYKVTGKQSYKTVGYVRIGIKRTEMVLNLLRENIGIFIIEFDCLWIKNPIIPMTKYTKYDLTMTQVIGNPPGNVAIGFYYMRPSERTKKFWGELHRRLHILDNKIMHYPHDKEIHHNDNDQSFLHVLLREKFANIKLKIVSQYEFPDGQWYNFTAKERAKYHPYIINNNWIKGVEPKIIRAKEWGHWFTFSNGTCNDEQVQKITKA